MPAIDQDRKALRQFELGRRSITQAEIAEAAGVSEATVSRVVAGRARHERVEQVIAEKTGLPRASLFPREDELAA